MSATNNAKVLSEALGGNYKYFGEAEKLLTPETDDFAKFCLSYWHERTNPGTGKYARSAWSPELGIFSSPAYGGGAFCVTSSDGVTWEEHPIPQSSKWIDICWVSDLNLFCAVSNNGTNRVMTSPDGINWTLQSVSVDNWYGITWSSDLNKFLIIASKGGLASSPDGVTWTDLGNVADSDPSYSVALTSRVEWIPELQKFITSGYGTGPHGLVGHFAISDDGVNWDLNFPKVPRWTVMEVSAWRGFSYSPELDLFCLSSSGGNRLGVLAVSDDPTKKVWTPVVSNDLNMVRDVVWNPDLSVFVAINASSYPSIYVSRDGYSWDKIETNLAGLSLRPEWSPELNLYAFTANNQTTIGTSRRLIEVPEPEGLPT